MEDDLLAEEMSFAADSMPGIDDSMDSEHDAPDGLPIDVDDSDFPIDHPSLDSNVDFHELYDEGRRNAAVDLADDFKPSIFDGDDPDNVGA